jgi:hypothetical protein
MEKYTYTEFVNPMTGEVASITRSDGASIPLDPSNSDYQRYLNPEADQPIGGNI